MCVCVCVCEMEKVFQEEILIRDKDQNIMYESKTDELLDFFQQST